MSATIEKALMDNFGNDVLPALKQLKEEAKEAFLKNGLPKFKEEEYKFTPIAKTLEKNFSFENTAKESIEYGQIKDQLIDQEATTQLIFINGALSSELSKIQEEDGLVLKRLGEAIADHKETVEKYFGKLGDVGTEAFAALNTALTQDGVFIEAKKNAIIKNPIYIYYINTSKETESHSFPRNLFIANPHSELTVVEKAITLGEENAFLNVMSEVVVHENAHLHQVRLQNDKSNAYEVTQTQVHQSDNSTYSAYTISLSGGMIRHNLNISSDGQNFTVFVAQQHFSGIHTGDDS